MTTPFWKIDEAKTEDQWLELEDPEGWWHAVCKWDGCVDLDHFANIPYQEDRKRDDPRCCDSCIHICDIDDAIRRLQAIKEIAIDFFNGKSGEEYWNGHVLDEAEVQRVAENQREKKP